MVDNNFGVPAGWYPDPLGLPQLRWWDAQAWTEHTSEARAPIVIQPTAPTRYADEEFPSRREQRERERRESAVIQEELEPETETDEVHEELSAQPLLAMTLKELEAPLAESVEEATPGPRRATFHANAQPAESTLSALAEDVEPTAARKSTLKTYTFAVWVIALMPVLQLVASILLITVFGLGHNTPLMILVWVGPYFVVLGLAAYDRLVLSTAGHKHPASAFWAFATAPGYLIARAISTFREAGKGFAPIAIWTGLSVAALASVLALPGLVISLAPDVFTHEVESSVRADASALGAELTVSCPAPPLLIGEAFTCLATKPSGDSDSVSVKLERQNGWINWRVQDWGIWDITAP